MQLSNYSSFPTNLPVIAEDELFLYPFMISPLFLNDEKNIAAAAEAIENNSLVIVCPVKPEHEGEREGNSVYDAGVIGSIMRKVVLPDGRIKVLFQGLARGHVISMVHDNPLRAHVDLISSHAVNELKMDAILEVLREKVRALSQVSNYFPPDLLRTIEENHEYNRIVDLICSSIKIKKENAYKLFIERDPEKRFLMLIDELIEKSSYPYRKSE